MVKYTEHTLSRLTTSAVIGLWNQRCDALGYVDDRIYDNDDTFKLEHLINLTSNQLIVMQENRLYSEEEPYVWMNYRAMTWQSAYDPLTATSSPYDEKLLLEWLNGGYGSPVMIQAPHKGPHVECHDWFWLIVQIMAALVMLALVLAAVTGKL